MFYILRPLISYDNYYTLKCALACVTAPIKAFLSVHHLYDPPPVCLGILHKYSGTMEEIFHNKNSIETF
jgi:hypothetical protein